MAFSSKFSSIRLFLVSIDTTGGPVGGAGIGSKANGVVCDGTNLGG